jgi:hypothetical protein
MRPEGVKGAQVRAFPQDYSFELTMDTWWNAVLRARNFSDFVGLDALYSYVMKSSTIVRSAIDKRLRPLKSRTFGVYINGKEDTRLTELVNDSAFVRELIYQRGLANFTYARVIGVDKDGGTFVYPLRNLDIVNKAVRRQTYDVDDVFYVKNHVNLFWMQSSYKSEDTLGLLEPVSRDVINMFNAQNDWQTASQYNAYQQMVMYYEDGDEKMLDAARSAAAQVGLGKVIVTGKTTDEISGKAIKNLELENVYGSSTADTFRTFKENIEQLRASIMQLILGSSLLGMSDKNTNSERLVRAHLKLFRDICEADAMDVQNWFNQTDVKTKLAFLLGEDKIANCTFKVKPSNYIDIGDVDVYVKMMKDLGLAPTASFIEKTGLAKNDVVGYENDEIIGEGNQTVRQVRQSDNAERGITRLVVDFAKRVLNRNEPRDGKTLG